MQQNINELEINGVKYVRADSLPQASVPLAANAVIIRTQSAGCFFGYRNTEHENDNIHGGIVVLTNARRLWYWSGAASLSQLAMEGTKDPANCKFPCEVAEITLLGVIEVIPCAENAVKSIKGVKIWQQ